MHESLSTIDLPRPPILPDLVPVVLPVIGAAIHRPDLWSRRDAITALRYLRGGMDDRTDQHSSPFSSLCDADDDLVDLPVHSTLGLAIRALEELGGLSIAVLNTTLQETPEPHALYALLRHLIVALPDGQAATTGPTAHLPYERQTFIEGLLHGIMILGTPRWNAPFLKGLFFEPVAPGVCIASYADLLDYLNTVKAIRAVPEEFEPELTLEEITFPSSLSRDLLLLLARLATELTYDETAADRTLVSLKRLVTEAAR